MHENCLIILSVHSNTGALQVKFKISANSFKFELYIMTQNSCETPKKADNPETPNNEQYKTPLTSGKKLKKIHTNQNGVLREDNKDLNNYVPMVNIMPEDYKRERSGKQDSIKHQIQSIRKKIIEAKATMKLKQDNIQKMFDQRRLSENERLFFQKYHKIEELRKLAILNSILEEKIRQDQISNNEKIRILIESCRVQEYHMHVAAKRIQQSTNRIIEKRKKKQILRQKLKIEKEELIKQKKDVDQIVQKINQQRINYQSKILKVQNKEKDVKGILLQLSIIKMQINPYVRVNFKSTIQNQEEKVNLLVKNTILWQKKHEKMTLRQDQFRFFILIQLYQSWRRMLTKLSYNFEGYKQILFVDNPNSDTRVPEIQNYIVPAKYNGRISISKKRSIIGVYTPFPENITPIVTLIKNLNGLDNGIIKILSVDFEEKQNENMQEIVIKYLFRGQERFKKFEFIKIQELSREVIAKLLPRKEDKVTLLNIEVPLFLSSITQKIRYEDVFDLIKSWKYD